MDGLVRCLLVILCVGGLTGIGASAQTLDPFEVAPKFSVVRVEVQVMAQGKPVSDLPLVVTDKGPVAHGVTDSNGRWAGTVRVPAEAAEIHVVPTGQSSSTLWADSKHSEKVEAARELIRRLTFQDRYSVTIDQTKRKADLKIEVEPAITVSFALESAEGRRVMDGVPVAPGLNRDSVISATETTPYVIGSLERDRGKEMFVFTAGGRVWLVLIPPSEADADIGIIREASVSAWAEVRPVVQCLQRMVQPGRAAELDKVERASTLVSLDGKNIFVVGRGVVLGACAPSADRLSAEAMTTRVPVGRYYAMGSSFRASEWQTRLIALVRKGESLEGRGVPVVEIKLDVVNTLEFAMDAAEKAMSK